MASSCVLCHHHEFDKAGFSDRTVIICDQCEREYHIGCLREHGMENLMVRAGCTRRHRLPVFDYGLPA